MAKLLVQESNGAREFELVDLEVNIGRELDNTLRLSDPSISRHHAVIRQKDSGYEIQDLQSSNGVLLNGNRVASAPLQDGDRITLGQMQLTFVDPRPAGVTAEDPLGTVRINPEDLAKLRVGTVPPPAGDPALAAPAGGAPAAPQSAAPEAPAAVLPGPAFLHPYLPPLPDPALPLRASDGTLERGDFPTRFKAGLIDYAPLLVLAILSWTLTLGFQSGLGLGAAMGLVSLSGMLQLVLVVGYLILLPMCWMGFAASPGKKVMKLRVVPEDNPAGRLDLSSAVMRLFGYLANAIISWILMFPTAKALARLSGPLGLLASGAAILVVTLVPYLLLLGRERKGLQDRFSRSMVIKVDR